MAITVRPEKGKAFACVACSNGCHDVLRPCEVCGRSVAEKRDLRVALYGTSAQLDALLFCGTSGKAVRP